MFNVDIEKLVPKFILNDKNGYAVAKAIEAALHALNDAALQGYNCITDYDTMPEWRLDELAWELNCLYDYSADISAKRQWIKNAVPYYSAHGTPQAIYNYLEGVFEQVLVEEFWEYGGDPYHFRVTVEGAWSAEADEWARKAIATAKNVRSVLDTLTFDAHAVYADIGPGTAVTGIEIIMEYDAI